MSVYIIGSGKQWEEIKQLTKELQKRLNAMWYPSPMLEVSSFACWGNPKNHQGVVPRHQDGTLNKLAIEQARVIVWVLPAGNASHFEAGYAEGLRKPVIRYYGLDTNQGRHFMETEEYAVGLHMAADPEGLARLTEALWNRPSWGVTVS